MFIRFGIGRVLLEQWSHCFCTGRADWGQEVIDLPLLFLRRCYHQSRYHQSYTDLGQDVLSTI